jgi:hypothetical protein
MNVNPPMNDDEVLAAVRTSLTTVWDTLDGVRMERPAEAVLARGHARRTRRAVAVRAALACGTAAATAAAVIAVIGADGAPARTAPGGPQTHAVAYAIRQVEKAIAKQNLITQNKVLQATYAFNPAFPSVTAWSYRDNFSAVQSGFMPPASVRGLPWAQGQESWAAGTAMINGKRTYVQVDYRRHEWYATAQFLVVPNGCSGGLDLAEFNPTDWMSYVRQTLSCGEFTVAGHARIDGQDTIKIVGTKATPNWWTGPHAEGHGALQVSATLYVDPATYLPIQVLWSNATHVRDGRTLRGTVRAELRWLPPTAANIARASVAVPAGFRTVPDGTFGGPIFQVYG